MANFDKKDSAKRRAVQKLEIQRKFFKALIQNQSLPQKLRYEYILKLHALPKNLVQLKLYKDVFFQVAVEEYCESLKCLGFGFANC